MPKLITMGGELIRINPSNNHIEYSTSAGRIWMTRYAGSGCGTFRDLLEYNGKLFACTDRGLHYSTSSGRVWMMRNGNSYAKTFASIQDGGREMLAMTEDGHLYYSTSEGAVWMRRR